MNGKSVWYRAVSPHLMGCTRGFPSYCPHLDPIERLWGLMHRHVTHNRSYPSYNDFCRSVLHFLRTEVPKNWAVFCDSVTDNFRVINPADFRVLKA